MKLSPILLPFTTHIVKNINNKKTIFSFFLSILCKIKYEIFVRNFNKESKNKKATFKAKKFVLVKKMTGGWRLNLLFISLFLILSCQIAEVKGISKAKNHNSGVPILLYEWVSIDFDWDSMKENKEEWINDGRYIPENCIPAGIKQYKEDIYVTVPRWMPGVPSTLNKLVTTPNGDVLFQPFPSLSFQNLNKTTSVKYVQDVEIDRQGRMWIIDTGLLNLFEPSSYLFYQPQLIIIDLENNNKEIYRYSFPPSIAPANVTFLNDIVIDDVKEIAYISNAAGDGGIYAFDFRNKEMIRFWTDQSTLAEDGGNIFEISGVSYDFGYIPTDGIALSSDGSLLFYCPLSGFTLYSIPTSLFIDPSSSDQSVRSLPLFIYIN